MGFRRRLRRAPAIAAALACAAASSACVTTAEFRKLEYEVNRMKSGGGGRGVAAADSAEDLQALREQIAALEGRIEVAEHQAAEALAASRGARGGDAGGGNAGTGARSGGEGEEAIGGSPEEVQSYRDARAAWRAGDLEACIDRFRGFLQTYPASDHADDAAYWMADCHYREGDYKQAVLRFADVVQKYPTGDKAPDALYRQGEALLRLGPNYGKAAETAFERLIQEYPDSPRVAEAKRQLELLGPNGGAGGGKNEG